MTSTIQQHLTSRLTQYALLIGLAVACSAATAGSIELNPTGSGSITQSETFTSDQTLVAYNSVSPLDALSATSIDVIGSQRSRSQGLSSL